MCLIRRTTRLAAVYGSQKMDDVGKIGGVLAEKSRKIRYRATDDTDCCLYYAIEAHVSIKGFPHHAGNE